MPRRATKKPTPAKSSEKSIHRGKHFLFLSLVSIISFFTVGAYLLTYDSRVLFVGISLTVFNGITLLIVTVRQLWRHEIDEVERMMQNVKETKDIPAHLPKSAQEEYEQYYILKSAEQSLATLKQDAEETEHRLNRQLRYLRIRRFLNAFLLTKRAIFWFFRLILPRFLIAGPSLAGNIKTIIKDDRFHSLRAAMVAWIILAIIFFGFLR